MFFCLNEFLQNACNGLGCMCINHVHQNVFYLFHLLTAQYSAFDIGSGGCVLPANHSMGCIHPPQLIRPLLTDGHAVCLQFIAIRACAIGDLLTHIPFENCANFFGEYVPRSRSTDSQICVNLIQQSTPMASRVATPKWAVGTGSYGPTTMATLSNIQFSKKFVPIRWVQSLFPISFLKHISLILTSLVIFSYIH